MQKIITKGWALELADAINQADKKITLTALSFLPPRRHKPDEFGKLYAAIMSASAMGIDVNIILPMPSKEHPATAQNASAARTLRDIGCTAWLRASRNLLHAKTAQIDMAEAWIGSGNMTAAAAHHNREAWMVTDDPRAIADLQAFHQKLIGESINSENVPL